MLKQGVVGNGVAAVQFALNGAARKAPGATGTPLVCDGIFGPLTLARVLDHQRGARLTPDGIVGPLTLDTLFAKARLRSTVQVTRIDPPALRPFGPAARLSVRDGRKPGGFQLDRPGGRARRGYPDLSTWLSPSLAELARQHQAFRTWWDAPHPKPPMPAPNPYPVVIPWDQVFKDYTWIFPSQRPVAVVAGPPTQGARRSALIDRSGLEMTVKIETESKLEHGGLNYKWYELEVELAAVLLKNRYGELKAGSSISGSASHEGAGYSAKSTLSLTQGPLSLWNANGDWFSAAKVEMAAEIAAGIALEKAIMAAELEAKQGAELQISVLRRPHETGLTLALGIGAGATVRLPIWVQHPGREPDEEKFKVVPFLTGTAGLIWRFF